MVDPTTIPPTNQPCARCWRLAGGHGVYKDCPSFVWDAKAFKATDMFNQSTFFVNKHDTQ